MLEQLAYRSASGQAHPFEGMRRKGAGFDLEWHAAEWSSDDLGVSRAARRMRLPTLYFTSPEAASALFDAAEGDLRAQTPGALEAGGWSLACYLAPGETKERRSCGGGMWSLEMAALPAVPYWTRERTYTFWRVDEGTPDDPWLDFPYDLPYDFFHDTSATRTVTNPAARDSEFALRVYGPCSNPTVYVAGGPRSVLTTVGSGEILTVDSRDHTVVLIDVTGARLNRFWARDRDNDVFAPVPPGPVEVSWNRGFVFDLVLYEDRGAPR